MSQADVELRQHITKRWLELHPRMHAPVMAEIDALMAQAQGISGILWGERFAKRTQGGSNNPCCVCGREVRGKGVFIWASPATGRAYPVAIVQYLPAYYEVSGYEVGPDCFRNNPTLNTCVY